MYERFTDRARKAMRLAYQEAYRGQHAFVDTQDVLLGIAQIDDGIACHVLRGMSANAVAIRAEAARLVVRPASEPHATMEKLPQPSTCDGSDRAARGRGVADETRNHASLSPGITSR